MAPADCGLTQGKQHLSSTPSRGLLLLSLQQQHQQQQQVQGVKMG
jgi:hypothetical protein